MRFPMDSYSTFIFDWDGTIQSLRAILMLNEALKSIGRDARRAINPARSYSRDISKLNLKRLIEEEEIENSVFSYLLDFVLWVSKPKLHNDSLKVLQALKAKGKKVAIFSNANKHRLTKEIRILGISKYIDVIVSAKDAGAPKPNPIGLEAAIKLSKTPKSRCIYIGDMVIDIITARLAGVASCAIADGFDRYAVLKREKPDYIYHSIEEFLKDGVGGK
ncbi:MAG: HAD-IA family hydrolase [Candidatus Micrarchaeaceae archaeon]